MTLVLESRGKLKWPTKCRCGAPFAFSCQDIETGQPAENCDFWCSNDDPEDGPHDWGVVTYERERIKLYSGAR